MKLTCEQVEHLFRSEGSKKMDVENGDGIHTAVGRDQGSHVDFSPSLLCSASRDFNPGPSAPAVLQGRNRKVHNNFLKGAKFSPDGTCLLTAGEDTVLRVFEVPGCSSDQGAVQPPARGMDKEDCGILPFGEGGGPTVAQWGPCLQSMEGETIYDFTWYPFMTSADPATCVYVSTSRDHPLHMWDAFTGALRATYRAYDHLDEVVAANSVCFNATGTKLFAGYNRMIRAFDVSQPGKSFEARPTCKTRKSIVGQRGLISALAFSPDTAGGGLFAAGSYSRSIYLYNETSQGRAVAELMNPSMGGTTHLKFSPDGSLLFSGARKDSMIFCWDVRQTKEVLHTYHREGDTNQRLGFDVDTSGRFLATGSMDNQALIYNVETTELVCRIDNLPDAVCGVSFHPYEPLLGLCTGQRHYSLASESGSYSDSDSDGSSAATRKTGCGRHKRERDGDHNIVAIYRLRGGIS